MTSWRMALTSSLFLVLLILTAVQAVAQTTDNQQTKSSSGNSLTVLPTSINLAATTGDTKERILVLKATQPITMPRVLQLDLLRADNGNNLPLNTIYLKQALPPTLTSNTEYTELLTINLANAPRGEYSGNLLLTYEGGSQTLSVNIKVKDGWCFPLVLLILGVLVGMVVTNYRGRGLVRDRHLVLGQDLSRQIARDPALHDPDTQPYSGPLPMPADYGVGKVFRNQLDNDLREAVTALEVQHWDEAGQALDHASTTLNRWRKARLGWISQLRVVKELETDISAEPGLASSRNLQQLHQAILDAQLKAATLDTPQALRDLVDPERLAFLDYQSLSILITKVTEPGKNDEFRTALDNLLPLTDKDYLQHYGDLKALVIAEPKVAPPKPAVGSLEVGSSTDKDYAAAAVWEPVRGDDRLAAPKIFVFRWATFGLAVGLLAITGFINLYVNNATFGANGVTEYFGLVLWGFGAETTRSAVAQLVQNWGIDAGSTTSK